MNGNASENDGVPQLPVQGRNRRRWTAWLALAVLAATMGGLAMNQGRRSGTRSTTGPSAAAMSFTVPSLRPGQPDLSLEALRGKPVVLNFWASWCVPCRREMPSFASVHAALSDRVTFLGIDNRDFRDAALAFLEKTGVRYASGFDPKGVVASRYGVVGMPTTVFIAPDGTVLETRSGELSSEELKQTISRLYRVS
jgi:cytochrome c biogenesis protein CcmG, thiol:disulfide interchange protein DsbE